MKRRSVSTIALKASNDNFGHYFMSVYSGRELYSNQWDELPIDNKTIAAVEESVENKGTAFIV